MTEQELDTLWADVSQAQREWVTVSAAVRSVKGEHTLIFAQQVEALAEIFARKLVEHFDELLENGWRDWAVLQPGDLTDDQEVALADKWGR